MICPKRRILFKTISQRHFTHQESSPNPFLISTSKKYNPRIQLYKICRRPSKITNQLRSVCKAWRMNIAKILSTSTFMACKARFRIQCPTPSGEIHFQRRMPRRKSTSRNSRMLKNSWNSRNLRTCYQQDRLKGALKCKKKGDLKLSANSRGMYRTTKMGQWPLLEIHWILIARCYQKVSAIMLQCLFQTKIHSSELLFARVQMTVSFGNCWTNLKYKRVKR